MSGHRTSPRFDVVASTRRQFSREQKLAIVAEVESGTTVCEVARRHNIHSSLLFRWRRQFAGALSENTTTKAEPTFLPVRIVVSAPSASTEPRPERSRAAMMIEIELATGRKLRVGPDVDVLVLKRIVAALETV